MKDRIFIVTDSCLWEKSKQERTRNTHAIYRQALVSLIEELKGKIKELKCDERKVSVFGKGQNSWEAGTYDEKQLVNAALSAVRKLLEDYKKEL